MVKEARAKTEARWEVIQNAKKTATRQLRKVATLTRESERTSTGEGEVKWYLSAG